MCKRSNIRFSYRTKSGHLWRSGCKINHHGSNRAFICWNQTSLYSMLTKTLTVFHTVHYIGYIWHPNCEVNLECHSLNAACWNIRKKHLFNDRSAMSNLITPQWKLPCVFLLQGSASWSEFLCLTALLQAEKVGKTLSHSKWPNGAFFLHGNTFTPQKPRSGQLMLDCYIST